MESIIYDKFVEIYDDIKSNLDDYSFKVALFKSTYIPNKADINYFNIKSNEVKSANYSSGGEIAELTLKKESLYGKYDVTWEDIDIDDIQYAILYISSDDSYNGTLISCFTLYSSPNEIEGDFTLNLKDVKLITSENSSPSSYNDPYVINLSTETTYIEDSDEPNNTYKGITTRNLIINYSDSDEDKRLNLISLAGKLDTNIDGSEDDTVPDFVSYKVFSKLETVVEEIKEKLNIQSINYLATLVARNGDIVNFEEVLSNFNITNYKSGDAIMVAVLQKDEENPVNNNKLRIKVYNVSGEEYVYATSRDLFICTSDASSKIIKENDTESTFYEYNSSDWAYVNNNITDIISDDETVKEGEIPIFNSKDNLIAPSGIQLIYKPAVYSAEDSSTIAIDSYYSITTTDDKDADRIYFKDAILQRTGSNNERVDYLAKDEGDIAPLDAQEVLLALNMTTENIFDSLTDEELDDIKERMDEAFAEEGSLIMTIDEIGKITKGEIDG